MPFFDFDYDFQVFDTAVADVTDFDEADPSDAEDSVEDVTRNLSLHTDKAPGGSIAWDDENKDAFVFLTSASVSGKTTAGNGQQGPGPYVYDTTSATSSSSSSAVG